MTHVECEAPDWLSRQTGSPAAEKYKQLFFFCTAPSAVYKNKELLDEIQALLPHTRSVMTLTLSLLIVLAAASLSAASPHELWNKVTLTHQWPNTFCSMEHCHPNISYWTLHGLWPDNGNDCNASWAFNSSLIEDLLPDLKISWPNLLKPTSVSFWKYEWHKHGTCAAKADSLNSEHKYFSKALELYHKVDLNSLLKKFDIIPSNKTFYSFSQIEEVIQNFYGIKPKIQCAFLTKSADYQTLGQIEICFDADFNLLDCEKRYMTETESKRGWQHPSGYKVCDHDIPIRYPPLS